MKAEDLRKEFKTENNINYDPFDNVVSVNRYGLWLEQKLLSQPQGENTNHEASKYYERHKKMNGIELMNPIELMNGWASQFIGVTPMIEDEMRDWFDNLVLPDYELIGSFMALQSHLLTQNPKTKEE